MGQSIIAEPQTEAKGAEGWKSAGHIASLDGVRGLAILVVLLHHFNVTSATQGVVGKALTVGLDFGWMGVDLFFVLSGFLITGILLEAKGSAHYYKSFYARRFLRIFPLYYITLLLWHFIAPWVCAMDARTLSIYRSDEPYLWTYLTNFRIALCGRWTVGRTSHFWSLAVEEQFYLLWPLIVQRLSTLQTRRLAAGLIGVALLTRIILRLVGAAPVGIFVLCFSRLDALSVGAWIAAMVRSGASLSRLRGIAKAGAGVGLMGVIAALGYAALHRDIYSLLEDRGFMQSVGYTLLAVLFGAGLLWTLVGPPSGWLRRCLSTGGLRFLGKYSYGIYVLHFPLIAALERWVFPRLGAVGAQSLGQRLWMMALGSAASIGLALGSWQLIEKRFLALKRHVPY